jgi:hypothetical protein
MPIVFILSVALLSAIMLSVTAAVVTMLSDIAPIVVILSVVMLSLIKLIILLGIVSLCPLSLC